MPEQAITVITQGTFFYCLGDRNLAVAQGFISLASILQRLCTYFAPHNQQIYGSYSR
jgi:hypothetical protein